MSGLRVIVCGGRTYGRVPDFVPDVLLDEARSKADAERRLLYATLDNLAPTFVIHGCAAGADQWADTWADQRNIPHRGYPADWTKHGRSAGPVRNQRMIDEGKPDAVIAFPGGRGTADMVRRAKAAGVRVIEAPDRGE